MNNQFEGLLDKVNESDAAAGTYASVKEILKAEDFYEGQNYRIMGDGSIRPFLEDFAEDMVRALNNSGKLPSDREAHYIEKDNEIVIVLKDVNETGVFVEDKIEMLQVKMAELEKLAKGTRKGSEQSHIYRQIDALEAELTKAKIEADE